MDDQICHMDNGVSEVNDENNKNVDNTSQGKIQERKKWSLADFTVGKQIAKGSFGILYAAKEKEQQVKIAMKILFKDDIGKRAMKYQVRREADIHTHLNHPNILRMYGCFEDTKRVYMVMELMENGDLLEVMKAQPTKRFSERRAAFYMRQLTEAMKYIRSKKIIHRDIELKNLLLTKDGSVKLTDFGWAVHVPSCKSFSDCGIRENMAPEMLVINEPYDYAVDRWAMGVAAYHLSTGRRPFSGRDSQLVEQITNVKFQFPDETLSAAARDLISKLITLDPRKRLSLDEIANHDWMKKIDD